MALTNSKGYVRTRQKEQTSSSQKIEGIWRLEQVAQRMPKKKGCFNPLMPKGYFGTSIKCIGFKKQMLQAANTELFNRSVPKAHNSESQNLPFPLQIRPVKSQLKLVCGFLFLSPAALMG